MKVLICGATSFVAKGFKACLIEAGHTVDCFSRGNISKEEGIIKGDYLSIANNTFFSEQYDIVVNFAVLKDGTVENNIDYIKSLLDLCVAKGVKKLVHFSSTMVYSHHTGIVDENAPIEKSNVTSMKGYGLLKIAVDEYIESRKSSMPFEIILVRPGYVLADNRPCPFIKHIIGPFYLILGNKKSRTPIVRRDDIHQGLLRIIEMEKNLPVYLFFPNDDMTKYRYAKQTVGGVIMTLPKWLFNDMPRLMTKIHLMPASLYSRFEGMFNENRFVSEKTEKTLKFKFQSI